MPHRALETKRTQSARDMNTVQVCVCERAQTVSTSKLCKWLQKPSIYTHVTTSSDTRTNRHKLNLCTVTHLGKMSELDQKAMQVIKVKCEGEKKKKCHTQSWRVTEVKTQNQRQRGSEEEEEEEQSNKDTLSTHAVTFDKTTLSKLLFVRVEDNIQPEEAT